MTDEEFKNYFNKNAMVHLYLVFLIYVLMDYYVLSNGGIFALTSVFLVKLIIALGYTLVPVEKQGLLGIEKMEPISYRAIADFCSIYFGLWCVFVELTIFNDAISKYIGIILTLTFPATMVFFGRVVVYYAFSKSRKKSFVIPFLGRAVMILWISLILYFLVYGEWGWNLLTPYDFLSYMSE
jgi:hypothetical protein